MPKYRWSYGHKAYTKTCSCCQTVTIGAYDEKESEEIFAQVFATSEGSADMADGFQSRCWVCNNYKRRQLGITLEWLRDMHQRQEGCCGICGVPISLDRGSSNPANVDHNDDTGNVRQLLCGHCNRGIGLFFHNSDFLRAAADYLDFHNKEESDG